MTTYSKQEIDDLYRDLPSNEINLGNLLDEEDVISGISIDGHMNFSSFTRLPYATLDGTKLIFGGSFLNYDHETWPEFYTIRILRIISPNLVVGKIIE